MSRYLVATLVIIGCLAAPARAQFFGSAPTLKLGDPAPPLEIADWLNGDPVDLAKGKGSNVYIVEFWATWCPSCRDSYPHLTELQHKYKNKGLVVVAVTDEPRPRVEPFLMKHKKVMGYTIACDRNQRTSAAYMMASGQMGIPSAFVVDREGRIAYIGHPFAGMDQVLEAVIAGTFDIEKAKAQMDADDKFARTRYFELMMALEKSDWEEAVEIAREVADQNNPISRQLRATVLDMVAWSVLATEGIDKRFLKEALFLSKAAYDVTDGKDFSIIYTYAKALFENGQVRDAVDQQRRAIELSDGQFQLELAQTLREYEAAANSNQ